MCRFLPPIVGIVGFVVFVFGVVCCLYIVPLIEFRYFLQGEVIKNGTAGFKQYQHPKILQLRVYLFDVKNAEEVAHKGDKAVIKEVGPYVYDIKKYRNLKSIDEEKGFLEFTETSYFSFNVAESKGLTEEDVVTTVNIFLMGLDKLWNRITYSIQEIFDILDDVIPELNTPFSKVKVKDLLFDGITIPCANKSALMCDILKEENIQLFRISENDLKLSMFNHINGTEMGPFVLYEGTEVSRKGCLQKYKGKNQLDTWASKGECNTLKGTVTFSFPPHVHKIDKFFPDLCRSIPFVKENDDSVLAQDIPIHRFVSTKEPFDAIRDNACFCKREKALKTSVTCNVKGTMSLQDCKNFPVVLSYPHFYLGDSKLKNYVEGLNPEKKLHESFASLEKNTGIEFFSKIRLQFNMKMKRIPLASTTANLTEGIFPILWFEDVHPFNQRMIDYFLNKVNFVGQLRVVKYLLVIFGVFIMLLSVVLVAIREIYLTRRVPMQRDDFSGRVISEKIELVKGNVNLYPQLINRNVSDSFMRSVTD